MTKEVQCVVSESYSIDIKVGNAIRLRRLKRGISQTKLGESIGVSFQQIQKYERGKNRISASKLAEIAQALDVDVRSFFDEVAEVGSSAVVQFNQSDAAMTRESVRLSTAFTSIPDRSLRQTIVRLVEAIAGAESERDVA